jgi:DNA-directed RNA polymerase subunit RPC12/RpoP
LAQVAEAPATHDLSEVVCPHCKKAFQPELLGDGTGPQRGFKCPHCRLFVPAERAGEPKLP